MRNKQKACPHKETIILDTESNAVACTRCEKVLRDEIIKSRAAGCPTMAKYAPILLLPLVWVVDRLWGHRWVQLFQRYLP